MIKNSLLLGPLLFGCGIAGNKVQEFQGYQGVIEFDRRQLGFEFGGRLNKLEVSVGSVVRSGQLLAGLDDSLERSQLPVRELEAAVADKHVDLVAAHSRPEEVRVIEARIRSAAALERELTRNVERQRALLAAGAIPVANAEDLESQLERATAQRQELEQSLKLLLSGARKQEVAQVSTQAAASRAAIEVLSEKLRHYLLLSPIAGEVDDVFVEPGEVVGGAVPVLSIADRDHPFADVFVPQAEIGSIKLGQQAQIKVDGRSERLLGNVERIAEKTEFTPRFLFSERERPNLVLRVRVRIADPQHELRAGVPAAVTVLGQQVVRGQS